MKYILLALAILLLSLSVWYLVKIGTIADVEFIVREKWIKSVGQGGQIYLIGSEEGEVFGNKDELIAWKFDSSDYWNRIKEGDACRGKVIGWRIPFLSWYRNIIEVECG